MTEVTEAMIEAGEHAWMHRNLRDTASSPLRDAYLAMEAARIPAAPDDVIEQAARIAELHICGGRGDYDQGGADVVRAIAREIRAALYTIPIPTPAGEVGLSWTADPVEPKVSSDAVGLPTDPVGAFNLPRWQYEVRASCAILTTFDQPLSKDFRQSTSDLLDQLHDAIATLDPTGEKA